jgi:hypothetical protein
LIHVLSYGAGVQSKAILYMSAMGIITPKPDLVVFADPGWESEGTYNDLQNVMQDMKRFGIEIVVTRKSSIKDDIYAGKYKNKQFVSLPFFTMNSKGEKGMVRRQCTKEYKIDPVHKAIRTFLGYEPRKVVKHEVSLWLGISMDEIQRMKPSRVKWITHRFPLIEKEMTRLDCLNFMEKNGIERPPKSSCIGCPFHDDWTWRDMKINRPDEFRDAVEIDKEIRTLPRFKGQAFLHRSCIPLDEINFQENQMEFDFFINECEGHCGL